MKDNFEAVSAAQELEAAWQQAKKVFGQWDELLAACRTATTELKRASEEKGGRAKAKAKAGGKSAAKSKANKTKMYQIFEVGGSAEAIQVYDTLPVPDSHDMSKPFILKGMPPLLDSLLSEGEPAGVNADAAKGIKNELSSFDEKFRRSDMRFTAGKAQRKMDESNAKALADSLFAMFSNHVVMDLGKWQPPSCFASIEKHRGLQFEVGGLPCLRFCWKGTRSLACIQLVF